MSNIRLYKRYRRHRITIIVKIILLILVHVSIYVYIYIQAPQRTSLEGPGDAPHKDSLAGVEGEGGVQHKVGVREPPGTDLDGFILDGGGRHAQVQLVVVLDTRVDQLLHAALVLRGIGAFVWKVHREHSTKVHRGIRTSDIYNTVLFVREVVLFGHQMDYCPAQGYSAIRMSSKWAHSLLTTLVCMSIYINTSRMDLPRGNRGFKIKQIIKVGKSTLAFN